MIKPDDLPPTIEGFTQRDYDLLRRELSEAHIQQRGLRRQLDKALAAATEAQRAHAKMVSTLTETMRENASLSHELEALRSRCQRLEAGLSPEEGASVRIDVSALAGQISEEEINAIRKAMARLHHPDVGGNPERMKSWNAALDRISRS